MHSKRNSAAFPDGDFIPHIGGIVAVGKPKAIGFLPFPNTGGREGSDK